MESFKKIQDEKRFILQIVFLVMALSASAQEWVNISHITDKFEGYDYYISAIYSNKSGSVMIHSGGEMEITTDKGTFNYIVFSRVIKVSIELLDINENLIELTSSSFYVPEDESHCLGKSEKAVGHIKNEIDHVKFRIERNKKSDFTIKVPCLNNKQYGR